MNVHPSLSDVYEFKKYKLYVKMKFDQAWCERV